MKDQYFGDVNDYRKYGLLRTLSSVTRLPVGVCWLLTVPDSRSDGEFRRYLEQPDRWRHYDPELYEGLRRLLDPGIARSVQHARTWELIPGATFYEELLRDDVRSRRQYFEGAWTTLKACPIVFLDPDNGIEVPSKRIGARDSCKYLYWAEIEGAYAAGHSLVIYQHFARVERKAYTAAIANELAERLHPPLVYSFRTSNVVFFVATQPEHAVVFAGAHTHIHDRWGNQIRAAAHVIAKHSGPTGISE